MLILSYGGGVNSTAMIVHLLQTEPETTRQARILFADTGAEWPETMAYLDTFGAWLDGHGMAIETVSAGSLVDYCRRLGVFPVRVNRFCTDKFKQRPIQAAIDAGAWTECIGFSAEEAHRAERALMYGTAKRTLRFPLIEAGIDR